jgi:zinc protease
VQKRLAPYERDDVRYVMSVEEEIEMYQQVTVEEIRALHADFMSNQAGEVSMVGDFDADEVKTLLKAELADWDSSQPYVRVDRDPHPEIAGSLDVIETPDKANAFFYSSQQYALADNNPAYASLVLGNFILGGGSLSSRLGERVRQQEGLSYGVRSGVAARTRDDRVDFTLYAITNPQNKDRLIEVLREELARIRDEGITKEELEQAKVAYLQALRVRRTDDSALAGELLGTLFNERTMQHYADHEEQINAATVDGVNEAVRQHIVPDKLVMAIAGDFAAATQEAASEEGS